jgi:AcrR family transcriptional regulator
LNFLNLDGTKRSSGSALFIHCFFYIVKDILSGGGKRQGGSLPRKADARLEGRILDAAYRLWSEGGEHALTMRAVAREARTTTPTLYERFRDKEDLLALLRRRARLNLFSAIKPSRSPLDACRSALDFFVLHPNEFRLIADDWAIEFARREPMPSFELIKQRLANHLGGTRAEHTQLALALVALLHGTATLLHTDDIHEKISRDFRHSCISACETLIEARAQKCAQPKRSSAIARRGF